MLRNRNGTQAVPYVSQNWGDLLKSYDKRPIMRDSIGNPTNDFVWRYTWQHGRQLASMTKLDGSAQWNYTYNADGLRTQRTDTVSGRTYNYTYHGDKLTHMTVDGHTMYFTYDASGVPLTMDYDGNKFYYVTNLQGDVISIINGNGTEFAHYTYDAWGKLLSVEGSATNLRFYNPLRYRGYVYDEETGLYYLQSRYYNPEMGRFINGDSYTSTGQGVLGNNMFAYCGNNPILYADSTGQFPSIAVDFLHRWLYGDGSFQIFTKEDLVTKEIKKSSQMQNAISDAIQLYKNGEPQHSGELHFTKDNGGNELYLSIQHCTYTIVVQRETKTTGFWLWKKEKKRYVATVVVSDIYNFDELRKWNSFGSIANNMAYIYDSLIGGNDFEWIAVFTQATKWETVH